MSNIIEFEAQITKVQTMADGGLRFTFDTGEKWIMQAAQLMEFKRFGVMLKIKATPLQNNREQNNDAIQSGSKRKSEWTTAEKSSADDNS